MSALLYQVPFQNDLVKVGFQLDDRHYSYDDSQILEIKGNLIGLTVAMVICKDR